MHTFVLYVIRAMDQQENIPKLLYNQELTKSFSKVQQVPRRQELRRDKQV